MHRGLHCILLAAVALALSGCEAHVPVWRLKAQQTLAQLERDGVPQSHPDDFMSVVSVLQNGERLLKIAEEEEEADEQYRLAYQKGIVLEMEAAFHRAQLKEEARQQEILRQILLAEQERQRREAEELQHKQARARNDQMPVRKQPTGGHDERNSQPPSHTVRRGETLPQVAARAEIYNDAALWPLIYRANRDQIKDPYQLWPGQILKIPRGFGKDDAIEARKQAIRRGR